MAFENGVRNIQAAAYNGARTVVLQYRQKALRAYCSNIFCV